MVARPLSFVIEPHRVLDPCAHCDVRSVSVCSAIDDRDLNRLAEMAEVVNVESGRTFIDEGEKADAFFNITAGTARLYKLLPDGRRQITGFAGVGHFLGLAVSATYAFSAEAVDAVRVCRFSRPRLRRLLEDFPAMEQRLLDVAANELVAAQEQMLLLGRKTARERLASFLVARSAGSTPCGPNQARLHLPMGRGDIADYLGLTIETVSRTLTRLKSEKLIEIPTTTDIVIRDRDGLEALAGGLN